MIIPKNNDSDLRFTNSIYNSIPSDIEDTYYIAQISNSFG